MGGGGARTDAARLTGVWSQAGIQQLRGDVRQRHATVEAGAHKLHHLLVAHHVPHAVAGQHEEAVLRPQVNLPTPSLPLSRPLMSCAGEVAASAAQEPASSRLHKHGFVSHLWNEEMFTMRQTLFNNKQIIELWQSLSPLHQ